LALLFGDLGLLNVEEVRGRSRVDVGVVAVEQLEEALLPDDLCVDADLYLRVVHVDERTAGRGPEEETCLSATLSKTCC
jgi:hypothetical protein